MRTVGFLAVAASLLLGVPAYAQAGKPAPVLTIQEAAMRFHFEPPSLEIPVVNSSTKTIEVDIRMELLDTAGKSAVVGDAVAQVAPGSHVVSVPWNDLKLPSDSSSDLYWYRLSYRITPRGGGPPVEGLVQLGRIAQGLLRLRISGMEFAHQGRSSEIRVRVDDPRTSKPVSGILVQASMEANLDSDRDAEVSIRPVRTNRDGRALVHFRLPDRVGSAPKVTVTASRGRLRESAEAELQVDRTPRLTISTDKPIYQPGQTLHLRILALGPGDFALANSGVTVDIRDHDDNIQFRQELTTSRFGVAGADWEIPSGTRLGPYRVMAGMAEGEGHSEGRAVAGLQISRYDLPEFTVQPVTDKSFYLPGEKVKIEISADYLFGRPVTRGQVRITRDSRREWDYAKQQWKDDGKELVTGELDSSGKFSAVCDFSEDFDELKDQDYQRYRDVTLRAYVTDLSTRRTEQKKFTARLSKQAIHIYVLNRPRYHSEPMDVFITTSYPDGKPASVDVDINARKEVERMDRSRGYPAREVSEEKRHVGSIHTNRYGVGRLRGPSEKALFADSASGWDLDLAAADGRGRTGAHTERMWSGDNDFLKLSAVKRLLRDGENVEAEITSSVNEGRISVMLTGPDGLIRSREVELRHGRASVEFPWEPEFRRSLQLIASFMDDEAARSASTEVLFPEPRGLDLGLTTSKTVYKPGEPVVAQFRVRRLDGRPAEGALGVVVFDRAVAERVRSDSEFGRYGFWYGDYFQDWAGSIAGVSYADLIGTKLTEPVAADRELLAQALLAVDDDEASWGLFRDGGEKYAVAPLRIFDSFFGKSLAGVGPALAGPLQDADRCPLNRAQTAEILLRQGVDFDALRDPWGMRYDIRSSVEGTHRTIDVVSLGPDKAAGTSDDFVPVRFSCAPYFAPIGQEIDRASRQYEQRTGEYIHDRDTLVRELAGRGIDLEALKDPWGHPYRYIFDIDRDTFRLTVTSAGPDGVFTSEGRPGGDDVEEWQLRVPYFQKERAAIEAALEKYAGSAGRIPATEAELITAFRDAGIAMEALRDPWGRPYHFAVWQTQRYGDHVQAQAGSVPGGATARATPVTLTLAMIEVFSFGRELRPWDRFTVARFERTLSEQSARDLLPKLLAAQETTNGATGAIFGTVTDPQGAVLPGTDIRATNMLTGAVYTTVSGPDGDYRLHNLSVALYTVYFTMRGFVSAAVTNVSVSSSVITSLDVRLKIGGATETVEVSAAAVQIETSQSQVSVLKDKPFTVRQERQAFTPPVRKYFPETLVWQPELVTGKDGRGELKFQMADNITAWKVSVVGSTTDGQMGFAEKEIRSFLPFFVDFDPPKFLTQGDHIELPVVLRNYTEKTQDLEVKIEPAKWFSILGAANRHVTVPAGKDVTAAFMIGADHSIREGKQRVVAAGHETGDAVERMIAVHPHGEEISRTIAGLFAKERGLMEVAVPQNAIPGSVDAQIKIYPDLSANIFEALDGLVVRPAGCGEQITSRAFGSLLALQVLKRRSSATTVGLASRARRYLNDAYIQLRDLQTDDGGFAYWRKEGADNALTAYVLDFLAQSSEFIAVDDDRLMNATRFLVAAQQAEGSWPAGYHGESHRPDANLTALIARSLATAIDIARRRNPEKTADAKSVAAVNKAMAFLEGYSWSDPYMAAQYGLTAVRLDRLDSMLRARTRMLEFAHEEGPGIYFNLEANVSPFYGWGSAGRLETTGLVVQALTAINRQVNDRADTTPVNRALIYLLDHKDRYGVWHSTQASINVLRAIAEALPDQPAGTPGKTVRVVINGVEGPTLQLPALSEMSGPLQADISAWLTPGSNQIELLREAGGQLLQAQVVETHYIQWADSEATRLTNVKAGETRALRLGVTCDKTSAKQGESVACNVEAERIGFQGYGMMLAEIGLPPGVDVDREPLLRALEKWDINGFDVLPDRIILYFWPRAGGGKASFSFRPRFAMEAWAAPSVLYDYYNPEARAVVVPAKFSVK